MAYRDMAQQPRAGETGMAEGLFDLNGNPGSAPFQRLGFTAKGGEFFGIWIVNILLSVITLGIYTAWATVRERKYFAGHTIILGDPLVYHARGLQIFIGRLIFVFIALLPAIFVNLAQFSPESTTALLNMAGLTYVIFLFLIPWFLNRSIRFNHRMTSWRTVRFDWKGTYWGTFGVVILMPIIASISLGLLAPLAHRMSMRYFVNRSRFGALNFVPSDQLRQWYFAYLVVLLPVFLAVFVLVFGLAYSMTAAQASGFGLNGSMLLIIAIVYLAIPFALLLLVPMTRNILVRGVSMYLRDGQPLAKFDSTIKPLSYLGKALLMYILSAITLGLALPWALVALRRMLTENTHIATIADPEALVGEMKQGQLEYETDFDIGGFDFGL